MKNKTNRDLFTQLSIACVLGALSIVLGAFSAHALEKSVASNIMSQHHFEIFEKAVKYQMYHSIVLLILALFNILQKNTFFKISFLIIFLGIILFSGSLYWISMQSILAVCFPHFLFWITPLGGFLMIIGWIFILIETHKFFK